MGENPELQKNKKDIPGKTIFTESYSTKMFAASSMLTPKEHTNLSEKSYLF